MQHSQEIVKLIIYSILSFVLALWWAPSLIRLLRWLRFWKKSNRALNMSGKDYQDNTLKKFYEHDESKMKIPRGGGIVIWVTTLIIATFFWILLKIEPNNSDLLFLNFVNRKETFIPLGTMFFGAILGLIDDALSTLESGGNYIAGGLKLRQRILLISTFSFLIGLWMYSRANIKLVSFFAYKIDLSNILGNNLSWLIIPITMFVLLLLWGSSVIDGFDGLTGGVLVPIFISYAGISYLKGFPDIAVLMGVLAGATLAFLWFNISPAKFYMGDTGSTALLLTLGVVAILIDAVYLIPIAGVMLMVTVFSNIIQITSKKLFKRKVFKAAPLHHHFEATGLKKDQIVFRYWIVSIAASSLSLALAIILHVPK